MAPARLGEYEIEGTLAQGGMGIVYRATHAQTGAKAAVKTVHLPVETEMSGIRREVRALSRIRHPGVVRIVGEGLGDVPPWYAMELVEGRTLSRYRNELWPELDFPAGGMDARTREARMGSTGSGAAGVLLSTTMSSTRRRAGAGRLAQAMGIVRQLCGALAYLHGEGIVHRDLKPSNVILRPDGSPVLVDFGLVARFSTAGREVLEVAGQAVGTLGYMAPEILRGELVDARADLYALGCILYELIAGRHPFGAIVPGTARTKLRAPPPPSEHVDGVAADLDRLVVRLLQPEPRDRVGHADDVARALTEVAGTGATPLPIPARAYLYRPRLAGREEILKDFDDRLGGVMARAGGIALLAGESGVGKTRLASEIARRARILGLEVLTGECVPVAFSETTGNLAGAPLQPVRGILRALADRCIERGDEATRVLFGARAKVLAVYEPAIREIPGFAALPEPPRLPPEAARRRAIGSVAETFAALARETSVLIVLDDLQWADDLTAELLARLATSWLADKSFYLLGTMRSDEAGPDLDRLSRSPAVARFDLVGLDSASVGALVADMMADDAPPDLVRTLAAQSSGNPFFVTEYLRTAVSEGLLVRDELGRWRAAGSESEEAIGALPLPASIREIVGRRLAGLDASAGLVIECAAILGREFDSALLPAVAGLAEADLSEAIASLVRSGVLEYGAGTLMRFVHDKLRELVMERLPLQRAALLHRAAAAALEAGEVAPQSFRALAHHHAMAGALPQALAWLDRAADHALETGAHREAIDMLSRARDLAARLGEPLGLSAAKRERRLADARFALGDLPASLRHAAAALSTLGQPAPKRTLGWLLVLWWNLLRQVLHRRVSPKRLVARAPARRDRFAEAALAAQRIAEQHYYSYESVPMVAASLLAVNLAERAGQFARIARTYAMLGVVVGVSRMPRLADAYFERARARAEETGDLWGLVFALYARAAVGLGNARFDEVRAVTDEALAVAARIGDPQETEIVETIAGHLEFYTGDLQPSADRYARIAASARARGNEQHEAWGLYAGARALVALGRFDEAVDLLERSRILLATQNDFASEIICLGTLAVARLRRSEWKEAREAADAAMQRISGSLPTVFSTVTGYAGTAETYVALYERALRESPSEARELLRRARRACRALRLFAFTFRLGRPISDVCRGALAAAGGDARGARRFFERGRREAERLGMPHDRARASEMLARLAN